MGQSERPSHGTGGEGGSSSPIGLSVPTRFSPFLAAPTWLLLSKHFLEGGHSYLFGAYYLRIWIRVVWEYHDRHICLPFAFVGLVERYNRSVVGQCARRSPLAAMCQGSSTGVSVSRSGRREGPVLFSPRPRRPLRPFAVAGRRLPCGPRMPSLTTCRFRVRAGAGVAAPGVEVAAVSAASLPSLLALAAPAWPLPLAPHLLPRSPRPQRFAGSPSLKLSLSGSVEPVYTTLAFAKNSRTSVSWARE